MSEFGGSCDYNAADSIPQVFDSVEREHVDFGVVPVENSTEGSVHATLDRLAETNLSICGEILTPVRHALMAKGADPRTIDTVVSHPQALAQCRTRLKDLLPHVRIREASSTAQAAQQAAHSNSVAALGSEILAGLYDLNILERDLQDIAVNLTRFLAIGLEYAPMTGDDKTSIMFAVPHEPGALCNSLATLAKHELNMTKIVSRPSRKAPWEYVFFVDFHGHRDEPKVHGAIVEMAQNSAKLKVLGSYRAAEWGKSHRMSAGPALDRTLQNGSAAVQFGPIANRS
jgi:chorismate mutase/prephenate dehydratase